MTKHDPHGLAKYVQSEENIRQVISGVGTNALVISNKATRIAEASKTLQQRIIALEADVTPQILRVSSELVSCLKGGYFETDIALKCDDEERAKDDISYNLNLTVKNCNITAIIERRMKYGGMTNVNHWLWNKGKIVISPQKENWAYFMRKEKIGSGTIVLHQTLVWNQECRKSIQDFGKRLCQIGNPCLHDGLH